MNTLFFFLNFIKIKLGKRLNIYIREFQLDIKFQNKKISTKNNKIKIITKL